MHGHKGANSLNVARSMLMFMTCATTKGHIDAQLEIMLMSMGSAATGCHIDMVTCMAT